MSAIDSYVKVTVASGKSFYLLGGNSLNTLVQSDLLTRFVDRECGKASSCEEIISAIEMDDYFMENLDEEKDEDIDLFIDFQKGRASFPTCKILDLTSFLDWYAATLACVNGKPSLSYDGGKTFNPFLLMDERIFSLLSKRQGTIAECMEVCRFFLDTLQPVETDYLYDKNGRTSFIHCEGPHPF